jgi:hypothetical protein
VSYKRLHTNEKKRISRRDFGVFQMVGFPIFGFFFLLGNRNLLGWVTTIHCHSQPTKNFIFLQKQYFPNEKYERISHIRTQGSSDLGKKECMYMYMYIHTVWDKDKTTISSRKYRCHNAWG